MAGLRNVARSIVLVAWVTVMPSRAQYPLPTLCAVGVADAVDGTVNAAYDIVQAAADCTLPGLSEAACASDLSAMMANWFGVANCVSGMTLTCGSLNNICAVAISQAMSAVSSVSVNLIAAASDCVSSPFICTYDVIAAVDAMNYFVLDLLVALNQCSKGAAVPSPVATNWLLAGDAVPQSLLLAEASASQRRLAAPAATEEKDAEFHTLQAQANVTLSNLRSLIEKHRKESTPGVSDSVDIGASQREEAGTADTSATSVKLQELVDRLKHRLQELEAKTGRKFPTSRGLVGAKAPIVV